MGGRKTKVAKDGDGIQKWATFTEREWKLVHNHFNIAQNLADKSIFQESWSDMLGQVILEVWLRYIFIDGTDQFDRAKFTYIYKGQKSLYPEVKAEAIIRVITNTQPRDDVNIVGFDRFNDYIFYAIGSYLRSLTARRNNELLAWLKKDAATSLTTLRNVTKNLMAPLRSQINAKGTVSLGDVEEFLRFSRIVTDVIDGLLDIAYGFVDVSMSPSILPRINPRYTTVLDVAEILFLSSHIVKKWTQYWRLRFQNKSHGSNFTMLCETIVDVGPTLIIVKDTSGHVFGCCASESWKPASTFYGDCRSFVFQLKPTLKYFGATNYNQNFQYHNQNQHMLPNGFGMGGRIGSWGFWLDGDFGKGHSAGFCGTFQDYSRLSGKEDFLFDHLEVWSIEETEDSFYQWNEEESYSRKRAKSIVDGQQLKNAILTMAGREPHST